MSKAVKNGAIGVFDSGVGGLSVWREIVARLPQENTLYFADQARMPYGPRSKLEIAGFCHEISRFLLDRDCKAIVVACNTASAASLKDLRQAHPDSVILGMEPAVKPAAALTRSGVIGVLATQTTFKGRLYEATSQRHASHVRLIEQACSGLAELIEQGIVDGPEIEALLQLYLRPILKADADTLVLACTHYPFASNVIKKIAGSKVQILDPAPAIARHLEDVLKERKLLSSGKRLIQHQFYTSGDVAMFETLIQKILGKVELNLQIGFKRF